MTPDSLEELKQSVEARLADHAEGSVRLERLRRRVRFLDSREGRAVAYLRELAETGGRVDEHAGGWNEDVTTAAELVTQTPDDSFADVVLRSAQHPLARDVLQTDVGEELDRLAQLPERPGDRWDLLILCQALLDRAVGDEEGDDPEPRTVEAEGHTATVYKHPVHGDIVVLVRPHGGGNEQWVLIDKAHRDEVALGGVAERLREPLEEGLVPWLQHNEIRHHVYGSDEMGGDTALA